MHVKCVFAYSPSLASCHPAILAVGLCLLIHWTPCPASVHLKIQLRHFRLPKLLSPPHTLLVQARPNVFSMSFWRQDTELKKP